MRTLRYTYAVKSLAELTELVLLEQGCEPGWASSSVSTPDLSGLGSEKLPAAWC